MFDVIEMIHSLNIKSYEELCKVAVKEMVHIPVRASVSKVELITCIIASRVAALSCFEDSVVKDNKSPNREKYCLHCENADTYYLELTKEQASLVEWFIDKEVYCRNADFEEVKNTIIWEAP